VTRQVQNEELNSPAPSWSAPSIHVAMPLEIGWAVIPYFASDLSAITRLGRGGRCGRRTCGRWAGGDEQSGQEQAPPTHW